MTGQTTAAIVKQKLTWSRTNFPNRCGVLAPFCRAGIPGILTAFSQN